MKIKPIFTTTVAKDVYNKDGSFWLPKGSGMAYSSSFSTKKFGDFSIIAPNPVHLFIANVDYLINEIIKVSIDINKNNEIVVFSKLVDGVTEYTTDDLLRLDPEAKKIRKLEEEKLYKYLFLVVSCLVSMIATVEAFVNQELPKDHSLTKTDKNGKKKSFTKEEIEVRIRLEEKIQELANVLAKKGYKQQLFWNNFKAVKKLRDKIVHLKTHGSDMVNRNDKLFGELFDLDLVKSREAIVSLLNYFIPMYIED